MAVKRWNGTSWDIYAGADTSLVKPANITAKGDILVGTSAGAITNVSVGSNTYVLTADSTQTSGVKWAPGYSAPTLGSTSITSGATVTSITGLTVTGPDHILSSTYSYSSLSDKSILDMMGAI